MISVGHFATISDKGKRANNEDYAGSLDNSLFLVCDGVGGSQKGEVASSLLVSEIIGQFRNQPDLEITQVMARAENAFTENILAHPETNGMATTLTLTKIRKDGILAAWCGDSRIYQFRKGHIVFRTKDHSWVNDALAAGMITEAEAVNHPRSRVITRAVQGSHKPVQAETVLLTDIRPGDLFLQCTDGVLEAWPDEQLQQLFMSADSPDEITAALQARCKEWSKDNFTAIVYQINQAVLQKTTPGYFSSQSPFFKRILIALIVVILLLSGYLIYQRFFYEKKEVMGNKREKNKTQWQVPVVPVSSKEDTIVDDHQQLTLLEFQKSRIARFIDSLQLKRNHKDSIAANGMLEELKTRERQLIHMKINLLKKDSSGSNLQTAKSQKIQ